MKTSVTVSVLQPFEWKGQRYTPGQSIALTPIDAVVLSQKRQVTLTRRKAPPTPPVTIPEPAQVPEPAPDPEPPKRRTYRRRDIQTEDLEPAVPVITNDPEPES